MDIYLVNPSSDDSDSRITSKTPFGSLLDKPQNFQQIQSLDSQFWNSQNSRLIENQTIPNIMIVNDTFEKLPGGSNDLWQRPVFESFYGNRGPLNRGLGNGGDFLMIVGSPSGMNIFDFSGNLNRSLDRRFHPEFNFGRGDGEFRRPFEDMFYRTYNDMRLQRIEDFLRRFGFGNPLPEIPKTPPTTDTPPAPPAPPTDRPPIIEPPPPSGGGPIEPPIIIIDPPPPAGGGPIEPPIIIIDPPPPAGGGPIDVPRIPPRTDGGDPALRIPREPDQGRGYVNDLPPAPPGYDEVKWANLNHQTPKYAVGRAVTADLLPVLRGIEGKEARQEVAEQFLRDRKDYIERDGLEVLGFNGECLLIRDHNKGSVYIADTVGGIGRDDHQHTPGWTITADPAKIDFSRFRS